MPLQELEQALSYGNVEAVAVKGQRSDVCGYARALANFSSTAYEHVFFMNCGMRGPFYASSEENALAYVERFKSLFSNASVAIVGAMGSCEGGKHVQTSCFMLPAAIVPLALAQWKKACSNVESWGELVQAAEVGLSKNLFRRGYTMNAMNRAELEIICPMRINPFK